MFKIKAVKQCLIIFLGLATVACSSTDSRTRQSSRSALPVSPIIPQQSFQRPRNVFVPPVFEEYRPQQRTYPNNFQNNYEDYVPERDYRGSYTSTIERQPPAVVEVLRPQPLDMQPVTVQPLDTRVERDRIVNNELDIDPFASVPDREVTPSATRQGQGRAAQATTRSVPSMSRAARALSLAAKSESSVGRTDAAINKVERALRIEPQSAELWHQLAELNFKKGRYDQAIGFARKSLPMASGNRSVVNRSLDLMSKAAVKSGNTSVFKEVLDYKKQNF